MATAIESSTLTSRSSGGGVAAMNGVKSPKAESTGVDASPSPAPAGFHSIRRAATVDETLGAAPSPGHSVRRRPTSNEFNPRMSFEGGLRRSSTFSEYSFPGVKRNLHEDIISPAGTLAVSHENRWTWVPLLFALLPAFGGMVHRNGVAFMSDIVLLGLAAVFLNWSVTQPWVWYQSARDVRVKEEMMTDMALDDDSDEVSEPSTPPKARGLEDVPEERPTSSPDGVRLDGGKRARYALEELYVHELAALVMAFVAPILAAGMLHAVRGQLSRPSEGWVSNFHLTIYCLAAEVTPLGHGIKLLSARTLHLQRVVHSNPYIEATALPAEIRGLAERLEELEERMVAISEATTAAVLNGHSSGNGSGGSDMQKQQDKIALRVRNLIQPELDALNRAVRRYEKKATVLASLTEARLGALDTRVNDAISLAAAAANLRNSHWRLLAGLGRTATDWAVWILTLPIHAVFIALTEPLHFILKLLGVSRTRSRDDAGLGPAGKAASLKRGDRLPRGASADRMPSRLSKR